MQLLPIISENPIFQNFQHRKFPIFEIKKKEKNIVAKRCPWRKCRKVYVPNWAEPSYIRSTLPVPCSRRHFARMIMAFLRADDANLTLKIKEIDHDIGNKFRVRWFEKKGEDGVPFRCWLAKKKESGVACHDHAASAWCLMFCNTSVQDVGGRKFCINMQILRFIRRT